MGKIKRNDPCPCGSGKKYKKCCGANNVIEFNPSLYNNELDVLNEKLMNYAVTHFEKELTDHAQYYVDSYLADYEEDELNYYISILSAWIILKEPIKDGQTIFEMFYAKEKNKIRHPRTTKIFSSWNEAQAGVFQMTSTHDQSNITLLDISTNQTYPFLSKNKEAQHVVGNYAVGILIPYVNAYDFLFGMIEVPKDHENHILNLLNDIAMNNKSLDDVFPKFLADTFNPDSDVPLQWTDPRHEMVAKVFEKQMTSKNIDDEIIQAGILFWNVYCLKENPNIKKPGTYASALDYLIQVNFVEDTSVTQAQLAKEYGTSPGTVSTNYRKLADVMENKLDEYGLSNSV